MYQTAERTALLLALLYERSGKARIRLSTKTFMLVSGRRNKRSAFVRAVRGELESLVGLALLELGGNRGGFAMLRISALDGAPTVQAKTLLPRSDRDDLSNEELWQEIGTLNEPEADEGEDEEAA